MFDTLHALDTQTNTGLLTSPESERESFTPGKRTPVLHRELSRIQTKLLTAWALGVSFGAVVEERAILLQHCLRCVGRLAAVFRLSHSMAAASGGGKGKRRASFPAGVLHLLQSLLSFLPWDGAQPDVPRCLGPVVDFSKRLVRLLLTPCPPDLRGRQVSSRSLSTALLVLQQVSECLDRAYGLQRRAAWTPAEKDPQPPRLWTSDLHHVPQLHGEEEKSSTVNRAQAVPHRPSSRCTKTILRNVYWHTICSVCCECHDLPGIKPDMYLCFFLDLFLSAQTAGGLAVALQGQPAVYGGTEGP